MGLSNRNRVETRQLLQSQTFDLLIIGGGLTGASIALDAATRGISTALLEMNDFGSGTSARLCMLTSEQENDDYKTWKQLEIEKAVIAENFSTLYQPIDGLHVKYKGDLDIKDFNIVKKGFLFPFKRRHGNNPSQLLRRKEVLQLETQLTPAKLEGGLLYKNGLIDRSTMTIELIKKADQLGAKMLNYSKVTHFIFDENDSITGVEVEDQITGDLSFIYARQMINATGQPIDQIKGVKQSFQKMTPLQNVNKQSQILINHPPLTKHVLSFNDNDSEAFLTVVPLGSQFLITATEEVKQPIDFEQTLTVEKLEQFLRAYNRIIPGQDLTVEQISDVKVAYERKYQYKDDLTDLVLFSKSGLITVLGTSITSYRLYASEIVDVVAKGLKKELNILYSESDTKIISINKAPKKLMEDLYQSSETLLISDQKLAEIIVSYGDQAADVLSYVNQSDPYIKRYQIDRLLCVELLYCIENAAIYTPLDFFIRRSRLTYDRTDLINQSSGILNLLADQLAWTEEERSYFERELRIWLHDLNR